MSFIISLSISVSKSSVDPTRLLGIYRWVKEVFAL